MRIVRAARDLGMRTIAVYSEGDRGGLWTRLADKSAYIGPPRRGSPHVESLAR
jgi:acetyl/propionyl-CoA carboxylase alpha subunit